MSSNSCDLAFACVALLVAVAGATQYKVGGGDNGWGVPDASAESYNNWAEKTNSAMFVYPKDEESVLLVEPGDYNACNTSSYDKWFDDGSTAFDLDRSGTFFFISGVEANCRANEKLIVMVAAANSTGKAPAPSQNRGPRRRRSHSNGAATQAPPPSSPSAPATAAAGKNSTAKGAPPAPANDKNGAGLRVAGLTASFVACTGYAMFAV